MDAPCGVASISMPPGRSTDIPLRGWCITFGREGDHDPGRRSIGVGTSMLRFASRTPLTRARTSSGDEGGDRAGGRLQPQHVRWTRLLALLPPRFFLSTDPPTHHHRHAAPHQNPAPWTAAQPVNTETHVHTHFSESPPNERHPWHERRKMRSVTREAPQGTVATLRTSPSAV